MPNSTSRRLTALPNSRTFSVRPLARSDFEVYFCIARSSSSGSGIGSGYGYYRNSSVVNLTIMNGTIKTTSSSSGSGIGSGYSRAGNSSVTNHFVEPPRNERETWKIARLFFPTVANHLSKIRENELRNLPPILVQEVRFIRLCGGMSGEETGFPVSSSRRIKPNEQTSLVRVGRLLIDGGEVREAVWWDLALSQGSAKRA
jgi:hypothetical protein